MTSPLSSSSLLSKRRKLLRQADALASDVDHALSDSACTRAVDRLFNTIGQQSPLRHNQGPCDCRFLDQRIFPDWFDTTGARMTFSVNAAAIFGCGAVGQDSQQCDCSEIFSEPNPPSSYNEEYDVATITYVLREGDVTESHWDRYHRYLACYEDFEPLAEVRRIRYEEER